MQNPKSVIDKLGVKRGQKVAVVRLRDAAFVAQLTQVLGEKPSSRAGKSCARVLFAVHCDRNHAKLATFVASIHPAGDVWMVYETGHRDVCEDSIRAAARQAGLVDVKVVRFSETHGAVRLVIPKVMR